MIKMKININLILIYLFYREYILLIYRFIYTYRAQYCNFFISKNVIFYVSMYWKGNVLIRKISACIFANIKFC